MSCVCRCGPRTRREVVREVGGTTCVEFTAPKAMTRGLRVLTFSSCLILASSFVGMLLLHDQYIMHKSVLSARWSIGDRPSSGSGAAASPTKSCDGSAVARHASTGTSATGAGGRSINSRPWWSSDEAQDPYEYTYTNSTTGNNGGRSIHVPSTTFQPWDYTRHPFPCQPGAAGGWAEEIKQQRVPQPDGAGGIFYVREMKTASSTVAGVATRIAHRYGHLLSNDRHRRGTLIRNRNQRIQRIRKPDDDDDDDDNDGHGDDVSSNISDSNVVNFCKVRFDHSRASTLNYGARNRTASFLFTFVRDPTKRALSQVFHFGVSREKMEPTDANLRGELRSSFYRNYYLRDLCLANCAGANIRHDVDEDDPAFHRRRIQELLDGYDFIGVTELMAESLVVLQMLLGLATADVVQLSAKKNGGYDGGGYKGRCYYIFKSFVSPGMEQYLASDEWQGKTEGDRLLHRAAVQSLRRTIHRLGVEEFQDNLGKYHRAMELAQEQCQDEAVFPCSAGGVKRPSNHSNCHFVDSGCGHQCLDRIADAGVI